jgi:hypothetical protein
LGGIAMRVVMLDIVLFGLLWKVGFFQKPRGSFVGPPDMSVPTAVFRALLCIQGLALFLSTIALCRHRTRTPIAWIAMTMSLSILLYVGYVFLFNLH